MRLPLERTLQGIGSAYVVGRRPVTDRYSRRRRASASRVGSQLGSSKAVRQGTVRPASAGKGGRA